MKLGPHSRGGLVENDNLVTVSPSDALGKVEKIRFGFLGVLGFEGIKLRRVLPFGVKKPFKVIDDRLLGLAGAQVEVQMGVTIFGTEFEDKAEVGSGEKHSEVEGRGLGGETEVGVLHTTTETREGLEGNMANPRSNRHNGLDELDWLDLSLYVDSSRLI